MKNMKRRKPQPTRGRHIRRNLTGRRFGRVIALRPLPSAKGKNTRWLCACDCGEVCRVVGSELTRGRTTSCGCRMLDELRNRAHDLTGQTFGRLTAITNCGQNRHGHSQWLCVCTCGRTKVVTGANLKSRNTQSCGCYHHEVAAEIQKAKRSAIPRGVTVKDILSRLKNLNQ